MTYVRRFEDGGIKVALGTALSAALKHHDQTFIAYVQFERAEEEIQGSLISFYEDGEEEIADAWSALLVEGGGVDESEGLRYLPGPVGDTPPEGTWGLAIATWVQATSSYHFYFYNLKTHELEDLGSGEGGEDLVWETPPEFVQFGEYRPSEKFSLNGRYAAAAIFDKALTAAQIESLARANSVEAWGSRGGIVGLWIFDQKEDSEHVTDLTGNGADQGEIAQPGTTDYAEEEGGLPQLPLREGEEPEREVLRVNVRLVGNVTGKIYCEEEIVATSLYKDPDLYLGYAFLATPFIPIPAAHVKERPKLDPTDTEVILQAFPLTPDTVFSGHWLGSIEHRPKAEIELSDPLIID